MSLEDQSVLVIGGSSGIGYGVAEAALREGARVTIASSNPDRIAAAAARLGGGAVGQPLDVTDEAAVQAFFAGSGQIDHIAFTAGDWGGPRGVPLADMDLTTAEAIFKVRFWGALTVAKHAAKVLTAGASLTFTDGTIAHRPRKGTYLSTASGGAIEHLTRGLAVEMAPLVRVNCVCPAMIRTEVWNGFPEATREATFAKMTARQLIPRIGEVGETAEAYLYLMKGGYTTGQVLYVEGGTFLSQ